MLQGRKLIGGSGAIPAKEGRFLSRCVLNTVVFWISSHLVLINFLCIFLDSDKQNCCLKGIENFFSSRTYSCFCQLPGHYFPGHFWLTSCLRLQEFILQTHVAVHLRLRHFMEEIFSSSVHCSVQNRGVSVPCILPLHWRVLSLLLDSSRFGLAPLWVW